MEVEAPPEPAPRQDVSGLIALQRSAGNAFVTRALLARVGGWKGVNSKSPNASERTVTEKGGGGARRIPIDGIPEGTQDDDATDMTSEEIKDKGLETETKIKHTVSEKTRESSAGGRAIIVIPTGLKLDKTTTLEVLVHLHGHTTGYRQSGGTTRDLGVERIEEQIAAAAAGGRPLIGVLPQGKFHSWFGKSGKSFDPSAYLTSVWRILGDLGVWDDKEEPPKRGGLILSSHSGGDNALETMLDKGAALGSGLVADLKGLFLLDTMYGPKDATRVIDFVKFRFGRDFATLNKLRGEGKTDAQLIDWVQKHGFRVRGAHSGGHYKPQMKQLLDAFTAFLAEPDPVKALGAPGTPLSNAVAACVVIDPPGGSGGAHDPFVGENDHLRQAIDLVPK